MRKISKTFFCSVLAAFMLTCCLHQMSAQGVVKPPKPVPIPDPTPDPLPIPLKISYDYSRGILTVGSAKYKMIYVDGGTFTMGGNNFFNTPKHKVTLSSYYIGQTEVTQAMWKAVMGSNPSKFKGDNLPVEKVSWCDCLTFIDKLNAATGRKFRLLTEAEWEYAARGGSQSQGYKYCGSNTIGNVAWNKDNSGGKTHAVAKKQANELGIYDMTGNVWEWCNDVYNDYSGEYQTNPAGPPSGPARVIRGGSMYDDEGSCNISDRIDLPPVGDYEYIDIGLRLALSEKEEEQPLALTDTQPSVASSSSNGSSAAATKSLSVGGVKFNMLRVDGGTFTMGATSEQADDAYYWEEPAHSVTLSSYYIGQTEVTQALWKAVMGRNPSYSKGDNQPVEMVSWNDCQKFISKLNAVTGMRFRLPTEAEWEYAARGGSKSQGYKYSGSNDIANVDENGDKTHAVATKQANELGIYDMSGNVWEWCYDWYDEDYYSSVSKSNPVGPTSGKYRVCRGGSIYNDAWFYRVSCRYGNTPNFCGSGTGLRLVLSE